MIRRAALIFTIALIAATAVACDHFPGHPTEKDKWVAPSQVTDFDQLYNQNCSACHGADGKLGAACPLNDPLYLSLAGEDDLREATERGVPSTSMPAFGQSYGGSLTDSQIKLLVDQMESRWGRPDEFKGIQLPAYGIQEYDEASGSSAGSQAVGGPRRGDAGRGSQVYGHYCAQCHGPNGTGGPKAGSIVDPNFLKLVSDQSLRTTVIAGRSDIGMPDWRSDLPGYPMTPAEISDVVAWISAQRPNPRTVPTPAPAGATAAPGTTASPAATPSPGAQSTSPPPTPGDGRR